MCKQINAKDFHTLEACNVRCRTVIVWSWAVTSFKLFGRLFEISKDPASTSGRRSTYYFSTHGCRFWDSLGVAALDEEPPLVVATAAARALLSKKFAIGLRSQGSGLSVEVHRYRSK